MPRAKINLDLLKGLSDKDEEEFRKNYADAYYFRQHMIEYCNRKIKALNRSLRKENLYSEGDWTAQVADTLGQIKVYEKLKIIIS